MPRITAVTTAVPSHEVDQSAACELVRTHFDGRLRNLERMLPVFANAGILTRYFCRPISWMVKPHSLGEKCEVYIQCATDLSARATRQLLMQGQVPPEEIDYIIYINTTGLATPSIDARLINILNLRRNIHRTPVWGLGCAGGVAGLSHAYRYLLGHPDGKVLLIATELCGLTFLANDYSKSNLVATALFGEGSAAVLVVGDRVQADGLEIIGTRSTFYPDSLDVMGWNIVSSGLQVVFAQRIPDIVKESAAGDMCSFLSEHDLSIEDISAYLFHPGGAKVLEAYECALGLTDGALTLSREVLSDYGNMSSATVLFVLERYVGQFGYGKKGYGLISALGPGFCSESMLIKL